MQEYKHPHLSSGGAGFTRKSRNGVDYFIPLSESKGYIAPGKPTSDGRVYKMTRRGYFVRVR